MNPARLPDASLYELAINSEFVSPPLQISPTTFKSLVGAVFDLLIDRQISATIWMKLPRGEVWGAEIRRFCQAATAPYCVYNLQTYQNDIFGPPKSAAIADLARPASASDGATQGSTEASASPRDDLEPSQRQTDEAAAEPEDAPPGAGAADADAAKVFTLPLAADCHLKREYFLLVVSTEFCGVVLAHRPRLVRAASADPSNAFAPAAKAELEPQDSSTQKRPLLGVCSFAQSTVQRLLESINAAICCGQPAHTAVALNELLPTWEQLTAQGMLPASNPLLLSDLLTKQIQRQEEIWRSGILHRRQASIAAALRQENEDLLNAIRGKDEFVKTMGQQLRTPLTSMKTALSLLSSPNLKAPQRQKYMEMLSQECDRQSSLITSVLDLVQIESVTEPVPLEAVRLIDVVPGVVSTYQPLAQEKGVALNCTISKSLPLAACLSSWLKQIVINLLHNSIKFTPSGGQVWVRARVQGDLIQLEFRDTGIGIAPGEIPKIFDRFYRVRAGLVEDASGAGLGLSIVQQLLLRCGGSISVRSKPGEGSVFRVLLSVHGREGG